MRKGIFALEALDESVEAERKAAEERATPEALASAEADVAVAEGDEAVAEVEEVGEQVEEAEEVRDTVDGLADRVEASTTAEVDAEGKAIPEEDRGISDETAETLEIAVEHFRNRLGFKKKVMPALEGFKVAGKRKQVSMEALANLRDLSARTDAMISIAQEGIIDTIGKHIVDSFNTDKGLVKKLKAAVAAYQSKGGKEGTIAGSLALRRIFSAGGRTEVTGKEAISDLKEYLSLKSELEKGFDRLAEISRELNANVKESTFVAKDDFVTKIEALKREAETITAKISAIEKQADNGGQGKATYAALSASEVSELSKLAEELLENKENEFGQIFGGHTGKAQDVLSHSQFKGGIRLLWESNFRLLGIFAADTRKVAAARSDIQKSVRTFMRAYIHLTAAGHSAIAYIAASTK